MHVTDSGRPTRTGRVAFKIETRLSDLFHTRLYYICFRSSCDKQHVVVIRFAPVGGKKMETKEEKNEKRYAHVTLHTVRGRGCTTIIAFVCISHYYVCRRSRTLIVTLIYLFIKHGPLVADVYNNILIIVHIIYK